MIIVYRPELENPPMDKECTIGFSFITGSGLPEHVQITSGVTRGFSAKVWDAIKGYDVVKNLLALGALRIQEEDTAPEAEVPTVADDSIADLPLPEALTLVEASFDVDQLRKWDAKDQRIRVKNSITKRISAITTGNG